MRFAALFALAAGALILVQWGVSIGSGGVPELRTAPLAIGFHLAAEILTALALLLSGLALLQKKSWGRPMFLAAGGMLLYSVINSPGYFAQRGQWAVVAVFGALFFLTVVLLMGAAFPPPPGRRD